MGIKIMTGLDVTTCTFLYIYIL